MMKEYTGTLKPINKRVAIVASQFNELITEPLVKGAVSALRSAGLSEDKMEVFWVPGSFELPVTSKRILQAERADAIIAIGAVIRGETGHYEHVAGECARGLQRVALEMGKPVMFGVLTTDTVEQALNRAGLKLGNKGYEIAMSLWHLLSMYEEADL